MIINFYEGHEMKYTNLIKAQMAVLEVVPEMEDDFLDSGNEPAMEAEDEDVLPTDPYVALLQTALAGEYQQWDLYTTYASRLKGFSRDVISEEFKAHAEEELDHIDLLQRYIVSMGHTPTVMRKSVPDLPGSATIKDIVELQIHFEKEAVDMYKKLLDLIKEDALRIDIENILVKEQEHVHDLELMLDAPTNMRVMSQMVGGEIGKLFRPTEPGEPTKPQAGYGCGCTDGKCGSGCKCGGKCGSGCKCDCLDEVTQQWCSKALKELTPELHARWSHGKMLSAQEKAFIGNMFAMKWGAKDSRTVLRFLENPL